MRVSHQMVTSYIQSAPKEARTKLRQLRTMIRSLAPAAEEGMGYGMPGYKLNGPLIYIGAFKNHVSLFAMPSAARAFAQELAPYKTSKGTIQFPLTAPLPLPLIRRIIRMRVKENKANAMKKG